MSYRARRSYGAEQDDRLPHGFSRIGYDADTQVYTFRGPDSSLYEGPSGARYGTLTKVRGPPPRVPAPPVRASTMAERTRPASMPTYNPGTVFEDFLPKYSRDPQPGHRTLLSRLLSTTRSIVRPQVPPKDASRLSVQSAPIPPRVIPDSDSPVEVIESPEDIPELAYLRLSSGASAAPAPAVPPKDAGVPRLRSKAARTSIQSIPEDEVLTPTDETEGDDASDGDSVKGVADGVTEKRGSMWQDEANPVINTLYVRLLTDMLSHSALAHIYSPEC